MSDAQNGRATIYAIQNDGTPIALDAYAAPVVPEVQSVGLQHAWDEGMLKGSDGQIVQERADNEHIEQDFNFVISAATKTQANGAAIFLTPLAPVALSHFKVALLNGTWQYRGGKIDLGNEKNATLALKLRKYINGTQNTLLTTPAA